MYLAEIVRKCKENVYRVIYLDYGNYENVHVKDIESVQKEKLDKVDVEGASTLLDMCDFDMKTGEKIEGGSLSTGGGSNSGGGGGSGRSHKRKCSTDDHTRKSRTFGNDSRKGRVVCADWKIF